MEEEDELVFDEEEEEDEEDAEDLQAVQQIRVYEQFVTGMLVNFPSLPLSRIYNMLKMFVMDGGFTQTEGQLQLFLNNLVEEGKLARTGDEYSLVKK